MLVNPLHRSAGVRDWDLKSKQLDRQVQWGYCSLGTLAEQTPLDECQESKVFVNFVATFEFTKYFKYTA